MTRVKDLLQKLHIQRQTVAHDIDEAEHDACRARKIAKRLRGLRRRTSPTALSARKEYEQDCNERLQVLKEIQQSLSLDVDFAITDECKAAFQNVVRAFDRVSGCTQIWDITSAQRVDRYRTRSAASRELSMQLVTFSRIHDSLLATEFKAPVFTNANGADLLLYPAFLVVAADGQFALMDIRDVDIAVASTRFVVADGDVPSDSVVIDHTWRYVNKNGQPDQRFSHNPRIPVAAYSEVSFRGNGLNEGWMVSNAQAGLDFGAAIQTFKESLLHSAHDATGVAPPAADEWPDLDLPERPSDPPSDWKTPLAFCSFLLGAAIAAYLTVQQLNPQLASSISDLWTHVKLQALSRSEPQDTGVKRQTENMPPAPVPLTPPGIAEMQKLLKSRGFDPGPSDGKAGARTHKALLAWGKTYGVADPQLDTRTLELLRNSEAVLPVQKRVR
jgi:hypothetical protein